MPFSTEGPQFALTGDHVGDVKAGKFDLAGFLPFRVFPVFEHPVVQRTMCFKFEGTDGMSDPFNGIGYGMGQVVHGIDAPLIACPVMFGVDDAVEDGVAHIEVRAGHVDLGAKYLFAVGVLAFLHFFKEAQVFFDAAVAVRAFLPRFVEGAR